MNTFGKIFRLTDFGESHGKALGGVIDGCPAGVAFNESFIQKELWRRSPGSLDNFSSPRKERDLVEFLSGVVDEVTTGAPIGFIIPNEDVQRDFAGEQVMKPSHSSFTYREKYGAKDNRYCGRASARQTVCRVVGGAVAKLVLQKYQITIVSETISLGVPAFEGDSVGAKVSCTIYNLPAGLGEPVYDKFHARLGSAILSINGCKGFEIGQGFEASAMCGSLYNDLQNPDFSFKTNHDGGVQGGITNGQPVCFTAAFKPIPSIPIPQECLDFQGNPILFTARNRNDKSVVPRVLPVIEAMAAMVTLDFLLIAKR